MIDLIAEEIEAESRKRLNRLRKQYASELKDGERFSKRTGLKPSIKPPTEPTYWAMEKHFHPIYCIRHRRFLAKSIWRKLVDGDYVAKPAVSFEIPKTSGGTRAIRIFTIPDAAVGRLLARKLIQRNTKVYSASSYAFRRDLTSLDAVLRLREYTRAEKVFVIQVDFKNYFDSIDREYLSRIVSDKDMFLTTKIERNFIRDIMKYRFASVSDYGFGVFKFANQGIPQGYTLSLFLANVAAHELDRALERQNGLFCRFADDTVAVTYSYEDAIRVMDAFTFYSSRSGIAINREKTVGIRLLSDKKEEIETINSFSYLGYSFSKGMLSISDKKVRDFKRKISKIIYNNLLFYPRNHKIPFNPKRLGIGFFDWDLVTCVNEVRRYLYGRISETAVERFLSGKMSIRKAEGALAYYCLSHDTEQLTSLDGWLKNAMGRAYAMRLRELKLRGIVHSMPTSDQIVDGTWYNYSAVAVETKLPSFLRAWRVARKKYSLYGIGGIRLPKFAYSYGA